jgi:GST-like protein
MALSLKVRLSPSPQHVRKKMIQVHSWATPNGHKVHIMLEECGLREGRDWQAIPVNIGKGDQFKPEFLAISPNNRIPAIVDPDGPDGKPISLFESGAILLYLAAKTHHFRIYAPEKVEYAINRYTNETKRLYGVMDKQLSTHKFIAGNQYTIADIAIFPWLRNWANQGIDWADYPHLKRWFDLIAARPAVQRGVLVLAALRPPVNDDKAKEILFGKTQLVRR